MNCALEAPKKPPNESGRLQALRQLNLLDTATEERFDRITRLAQRLFEVPFALVSLIDANRQWFKSCQGLNASETPRAVSFCGHAILSDEPFYIPNALEDPRFSDNPLVTGEPFIQSYLGYPLKAPSGDRIGTLCVIDIKPRDYRDADIRALIDLGALVEAELTRQHLFQARTRILHHELTLKALKKIVGGIQYRCAINPPHEIESISGEVEALIGQPATLLIESPTHWAKQVVHPDDLHEVLQAYQEASKDQPTLIRYRVKNKDEQYIQVTDHFIYVLDERESPTSILGVIKPC